MRVLSLAFAVVLPVAGCKKGPGGDITSTRGVEMDNFIKERNLLGRKLDQVWTALVEGVQAMRHSALMGGAKLAAAGADAFAVLSVDSSLEQPMPELGACASETTQQILTLRQELAGFAPLLDQMAGSDERARFEAAGGATEYWVKHKDAVIGALCAFKKTDATCRDAADGAGLPTGADEEEAIGRLPSGPFDPDVPTCDP